MGGILGRTRCLSSNFYCILPINRWLDRETKLDVRVVSKILYKPRIEQLGIAITSYIIYI